VSAPEDWRHAETLGGSAFARRIFTPMQRADQRRWAEVYLQGLLTIPGKKTIRKMTDGIVDLEPSAATQSLQQFISQSTWDWYQVREMLAGNVQERLEPKAWVINQAIVPKRGRHSVGVGRRFVASAGRTVNCQVGIGLFLAADAGSAPIDWSLAIDDTWNRDEERRSRARIPDDAVGKSDATHILDMVDRVLGDWRLPAAPLVSQICDCPDAFSLLSGLIARGMDFLVEVPGSIEVAEPMQPVRVGGPPSGRPGGARGAATMTAKDIGRSRTVKPQVATTALASGDLQRFHLLSSLVHLPGVRLPAGVPDTLFRLYAEWSPTEGRPLRFWVTNLLYRHPDELMHLAALGRHSAADLQHMEDHFGVRDFEGRSYPGWHRHMTLVSAAYSYAIEQGGGLPPWCHCDQE
jgi:hypothetical protein